MSTNKLIYEFESLPFWIRFIFALPGLDGIVYGIYRILKGCVIEGVIWLIAGTWLTWIVDIFCLLYKGRVICFTELLK